jgi:hypothetical protein
MLHQVIGPRAALFFYCLLTLLQGCYLLSPQIRTDCSFKREYLMPSDSSSAKDCSATPAQPTLESALAYAQATKDEYAKADNQYSSFSTPLALTIIPVSAAALGLGISGVAGAPITGLGMGAATGLATGAWLQNKPREGVYEVGETAVQCVIDQMQGFALNDCSRSQLKSALYGTTDDITKNNIKTCGGHPYDTTLLDDIEALSTILDSLDTSGATPNDKLIVAAGRQAVTAADLAYDAGAKFFSYSSSDAGRDTVSGVDTINIAVASAVKDTEPSIESLATSVSGAIPSSARQLAGLGAAATQSAAQANNTNNSIPKPKILQNTPAEDASRRTTALLARVDYITAQIGTGGAPATTVCEKMAQTINESKPLTLTPDGDVTLSAGGQDVTITLSGGKPAYAASFKGAAVPTGLTVSVTNASTSGILTLSAAKATISTNPVPLFISDSSGMGKTINVTVK